MGWVVNSRSLALYPLERPGTHCIGRPRAQGPPGRMMKISPPLEFDPRAAWPVASRYTDWTIRAYHRWDDNTNLTELIEEFSSCIAKRSFLLSSNFRGTDSPPWINWIYSILWHSVSLKSILMSPLLLHLRLPNVFFPSGFTSIVMTFSSQTFSACLIHLIPFDCFTLPIICHIIPTNYEHYYYYYRIPHFSALAGIYSPNLGFSNQQD